MNLTKFFEGENNNNLIPTAEEFIRIKEKYESSHFSFTTFNFINDHKGLREGNIHILMGAIGQGKSTLARAVALSFASQLKILLYSTEESRSDTIFKLYKLGVSEKQLSNIVFLTEDEVRDSKEDLVDYIAKKSIENDVSLIFFDNLTTSIFYEGKKPDDQSELFERFQKMVRQLDKPCFIVAHISTTAQQNRTSLISTEDIRGSKIPTMKAEYVYAYQMITYESKDGLETSTSFVRTIKARMNGKPNATYKLYYDINKQHHTKDYKISFNEFKEIFDNRIKLK